MIRFCTLASGSRGNSTFVQVDNCAILLDAGLTFKKLISSLTNIGKHVGTVQYVFFSHEHQDHVGARNMLKKHCMSITHVSKVDCHLEHGQEFMLPGGGKVTAFSAIHDEECFGYLVEDVAGRKLAYLTDSGGLECESLKYLIGVNAILIETNHDAEMNIAGPYPDELKLRVDETHLENGQAHDIIKMIDHPKLEMIIGIHLSEKNNSEALAGYELESATKHAKVVIARQNEPTCIFTIL